VSLDTSIVQKLENLLLVAVPRDLTDSDVLDLRREVLRQIRQHSSRWVLLDFSRVDICDSFFGRFIQSTAHMAELMGAQVIVSGLQDAVVETMVGLGMILPNIHAVLDLDDALALSRESDAKAKNRATHLELFADLTEEDGPGQLPGGESPASSSDLMSSFFEV
jgi:rsbT antagonist protein RsbS